MPELKGFSERNLTLMTQFAREYPDLFAIGQQVVAQLGGGAPNVPKGQQRVAQLAVSKNP
jgi:hypothetical protein